MNRLEPTNEKETVKENKTKKKLLQLEEKKKKKKRGEKKRDSRIYTRVGGSRMLLIDGYCANDENIVNRPAGRDLRDFYINLHKATTYVDERKCID